MHEKRMIKIGPHCQNYQKKLAPLSF